MSSGKAFPRQLFLRKVDIDDLNFNGAEGDVHCIFSPSSYLITHTEKYISNQEHSALLEEKDKEIAKLRAALEFYAVGENWETNVRGKFVYGVEEAIACDGGSMAREALAGGEGES